MSQIKRLMWTFALLAVFTLADFSIARGESLPDDAYVIGVVGHAQGYAIDCEVRSAVDLAAYWGVNIGETQFLQALPSSDNPDQGFVGNANEVWGRLPPNGYGVHAGPIAQTLRDFGLPAEARRGLVWDDVRGEISAGRPVIVWVIGTMWSGTSVDYQAADGSIIRVAAYEHTMLITGYSKRSVQVIDAGSGQYEYYWLSDFLNSWSVLGNMAVFASSNDHQPQVTASESTTPEANTSEVTAQEEIMPKAQGNTYTVQLGDHLMALARSWGISWQELADLNFIYYPYTIYVGQVLTLPEGTSPVVSGTPEPQPTPVEATPTTKNNRPGLPLPTARSHYYNSKNLPTPTPSIDAKPVKTVIVVNTNTLIGFARSIGIAWHVLAELNNLPGTYILSPGEVLKVP